MGILQFNKIDINDFWDRTPTKLKYFLILAIFFIAIYFLFSRTVSNAQIKELEKIEQTIETTYELIERFEEFRSDQYIYNSQILVYLENLYTLIEELNYNINRKFDILLLAGGSDSNILDKLTLLNESFEKLQKAYTPEEFEQYIKDYENSSKFINHHLYIKKDTLK